MVREPGAPVREREAERVVRLMRFFGFVPSETSDVHHVEFWRQYAEAPSGRLVRVIVQFDRPAPGGILGAAAGVHAGGPVSIKIQTEERFPPDALERAPDLVRADLAALLEGLGRKDARPLLTFERCTAPGCGAAVSEFFVIEGEVLCRACREARR
jgi:hypothetical protein